MHARNLLNLALLVFIIVLVVLVTYEPGKEKPVTPPTLTLLNAEEISSIRIQQVNNENIELVKKDKQWFITAPFKSTFKANQYRIDSLIQLATTVSFSQNDLTGLNKKDFGLDTPYGAVNFKDHANNETTIIFGHNKSLKKHRYVQIDNTLHMISDTFYYQVAARAESFIDHGLLAAEQGITTINIPGMLLKEENANWSIKPKPEHYSQDQINQLISNWKNSQAYDLRYTPEKINQHQPDITVIQGKLVTRFKIINDKDDFILLNLDTGLEYIIAKDRKDALLKLPEIEKDDESTLDLNPEQDEQQVKQ